MKRRYSFWKFVSRRKYLIVSVLGIAIIGFIGENSIMKHVQNRMLIREMKKEINDYNTQYEKDERTKADDEDIFVLSDDNKQQEDDNETTK